MNATKFYDLVSGRRRGLLASLLRAGLAVAELPYWLVARSIGKRFDSGKLPAERVEALVVSVGNLTVGGTGKTPMIKWIARWFRAREMRVAILSRGYGATDGARNDEALELEQALPDVPHLQSPNRVEIARTAIEELESQVLLLDDGFQHRRLARDGDIVLLDATQPFGYEHLLPRGTLREPIAGIARAGVVCLSRADLISNTDRDQVRTRVAKLAPQAIWCELVHRPTSLLDCEGNRTTMDELAGKRVVGFCGIGNPAAFCSTLENVGASVVDWVEFPDHHSFVVDDVAQLTERAKQSGAELAICTHKDLVKLQVEKLGDVKLWAVEVELEFLTGQEQFEAHLASLIQP